MGNSTIVVNTESGDVSVRKMPLADYAELLRALDKLPKQLVKLIDDKDLNIKKMSNDELFSFLPKVIADSWADLTGLIAVPTDKDSEFMAKLDGADALDVILAIITLNDFGRIIATVKKMLALRAPKAPTAKVNPQS